MWPHMIPFIPTLNIHSNTSYNLVKTNYLKKTAYISAFFITGSGLSLILILKPLYITVINTNVTRPLSNNTKKPLNLFFYLFNIKGTY
jgi:hypothetical protein